MSEQILLVDREANRSRLLQRKLERFGLKVTTVGSLEEATDGTCPARIMVIDVAMLCGSERGRIDDLVSQWLGVPSYECAVCGRRLREVNPGRGLVSCCGQPMELVPLAEADDGEEVAIW